MQHVMTTHYTVNRGYSDAGLFRLHVQIQLERDFDRRNSPASLTFSFRL